MSVSVGMEHAIERVRHARFNLNTARSEFLEALKICCQESLDTCTAAAIVPGLRVSPTHDRAVIVVLEQGDKRTELRYADGDFEPLPLELETV